MDMITFAVKYNTNYTDINNHLSILKSKVKINFHVHTEKYIVAHIKLYRDFTFDEKDFREQAYMFVKVIYYKGKVSFEFTNSVRKWYFGNDSLRDFNLLSLEKCFQLLSEKIMIPYSIFMQAKIYTVEMGVTLRFPSNFRNFLLCLVDHKELKLDYSYGKQTAGFIGANYSIKFYDKLTEMKGKLSSKTIKKLNKHFFFLRVEIKIEKVSGVQVAKNLFSTLEDLVSNWSKVYDYYLSQLRNVEIIDWISPRTTSLIDVKGAKKMDELLMSSAIENIGLGKVLKASSSLRSEYKTKLKRIAVEFRELKVPSYEDIFFATLDVKLKRIAYSII